MQGIPASVRAIWTGSSVELTLDRTAISVSSTPPTLHAEIVATGRLRAALSWRAHDRDRPSPPDGRVEVGERVATPCGCADRLGYPLAIVRQHVARSGDDLGRTPVIDLQRVPGAPARYSPKSMRYSGVAPVYP